MNLPDLSDEQVLAAALGCTPETVQAGALRGDLPGIKFGRGWVFPREATMEAINRAARLQAEARAKVKTPAAVGVAPVAGKAKRGLPVLPDLR